MPKVTPSIFATHQLELLQTELQAETAHTLSLTTNLSPAALARAGLAVRNLILSSQRTGLGGKTILDLVPDPSLAIPSTTKHAPGTASSKAGDSASGTPAVRVGDVVRVSLQPKGDERKAAKSDLDKKGCDGVVVRSAERGVEVAIDKEEGADALATGRLWIVKLANEVTYKRMNFTMKQLQKMSDSEHSFLIRILFGLAPPTVPTEADVAAHKDIPWFDPSLNESQKEAIRFTLASPDLSLIHGPPGTGKTHTLIELIRQMLRQWPDQRILVCGPSNISVDNIVERLAPHKIPLVRLGHPARLLPSVLSHSLDVLTRTSDAAELVRDIRQEMDTKQASIKKTKSGRERKAIYGELKALRAEYRERERACVENLVRDSRIVLATLHGAGGFHLRGFRFDTVIIDEASQALEAQCWIPLIGARKVVLAGDHLQLPPTVKSKDVHPSKARPKLENARVGEKNKEKSTTNEEADKTVKLDLTLETTLFDRQLSLHGPGIKRMLTTQYRMHERIMRFPSDELYEAKLVAAESVKARVLPELPYKVEKTDDTVEPLIFWDTQGGDFAENADDAPADGTDTNSNKKPSKASILGESKSNDAEASLVAQHVDRLVSAGVLPEDIAIVTPYNAQLSRLSDLLKEKYPSIELGTVDGFQGREKEAVVVSLVRSNAEHEVGFLGEKRRLNVAMTRPKRHLCVIGDSETVSRGSSFLKHWMNFLEEHADLRYPNLADLHIAGS